MELLSPRWRKVIRDLWGNKGRTGLVVLSIAAGIFAIGTIASTQVILSNDLASVYAASNPPSAIIFTRSLFDDELVQAIRGLPGIQEAEARRSVTVRLQVGPDQWRNLSLMAYPDYQDIRINKIWPVEGAWPPPKHQVLLERAALSYLNVQIGDVLRVETPGSQQRELRVAGQVYDPSRLSPILQSTVNGYISLDTMQWLGQPRTFGELRIVVAGGSRDRQQITQVANQVRDKIERGGREVSSVSIPANLGKHPASDIMEAVILILGALGILSLFLSGFLVVNTISALMSQQVRQIGIMRAVGARLGQVMGLYLGLVLIFGLLSLVIAVPAGALGARAVTTYTGGLINLDIISPPLSPQVLLLEIAVGLLVPLLAALYPILAGLRITVREALSDYGLGQMQFGSSLMDRLITTISTSGRFSRPLLLSLRNTFRRKSRLALTLITLTLGGATFIAVFSVQASILRTLDDALQYWGYDAEVSFRRAYRMEQIRDEVLQVPGVVEAENWGFASARRIRSDDSEGDPMLMIAPPAATAMLKPTMLQGRWLLPEDESAVVINTDVRDGEPDIPIGDEIVLKIGERKITWQVVGLARGVLAGPTVYANYPYFAQVMRTVGRAGRVQIVTGQHDAAFQVQIAQALEAHFRDVGLQVSSSQTTGQLRERTVSQFNILIGFLLIMALVLAAVGGLGLMGVMGINVLERRREIGVMRALGASDSAVLQIVMVEGVLIGLISWFLGMILALPLGKVLSDSVGMSILKSPFNYAYSFPGAWLWLALAVCIAAVSSYLPARRASQLTVHEVLAYE